MSRINGSQDLEIEKDTQKLVNGIEQAKDACLATWRCNAFVFHAESKEYQPRYISEGLNIDESCQTPGYGWFTYWRGNNLCFSVSDN